jgi:hypothetical protein
VSTTFASWVRSGVAASGPGILEPATDALRLRARVRASVNGLPPRSIHRPSLNPIVCTTRVSPSHFPDEYPLNDGFGSTGNGRPSVKIWR